MARPLSDYSYPSGDALRRQDSHDVVIDGNDNLRAVRALIVDWKPSNLYTDGQVEVFIKYAKTLVSRENFVPLMAAVLMKHSRGDHEVAGRLLSVMVTLKGNRINGDEPTKIEIADAVTAATQEVTDTSADRAYKNSF